MMVCGPLRTQFSLRLNNPLSRFLVMLELPSLVCVLTLGNVSCRISLNPLWRVAANAALPTVDLSGCVGKRGITVAGIANGQYD